MGIECFPTGDDEHPDIRRWKGINGLENNLDAIYEAVSLGNDEAGLTMIADVYMPMMEGGDNPERDRFLLALILTGRPFWKRNEPSGESE